MKQTIYAFLLFGILLSSCKDKKQEEKAAAEAKAKLVQEIKTLDSTTKVINDVKTDLEQTAQQLDNLLNDLDN